MTGRPLRRSLHAWEHANWCTAAAPLVSPHGAFLLSSIDHFIPSGRTTAGDLAADASRSDARRERLAHVHRVTPCTLARQRPC